MSESTTLNAADYKFHPNCDWERESEVAHYQEALNGYFRMKVSHKTDRAVEVESTCSETDMWVDVAKPVRPQLVEEFKRVSNFFREAAEWFEDFEPGDFEKYWSGLQADQWAGEPLDDDDNGNGNDEQGEATS